MKKYRVKIFFVAPRKKGYFLASAIELQGFTKKEAETLQKLLKKGSDDELRVEIKEDLIWE